MSKYLVQWESLTDNAGDPLQAAKWCMESIVNGEALAFTVTDLKTKQEYSVDLGDDDEDAVVEIKKHGKDT